MLWIILTTTLLIWTLQAYSPPRMRPWIWGVACSMLVVLLLWAMQRSDFGALLPGATGPAAITPATTPVIAPAINPEQVQIAQIKLTGKGAPWTLSGRLANTTDYVITAVTIAITRTDCNAPPDQTHDIERCTTIWHGKTTVQLELPPQQARNFTATIWTHTQPPHKQYVLHDQFKILAVSGHAPN